jgi:lipid A ethanolaminephosphotransferase
MLLQPGFRLVQPNRAMTVPIHCRSKAHGVFAAPVLSSETLLAVASLWWLMIEHRRLWSTVAQLLGAQQLVTMLALAGAVWAVNTLLLLVLTPRRLLKPVVLLLSVVAAVSSYYVERYGIFLDPSMLRNVLHTDVAEARELLHAALLWHVFWHEAPVAVVLAGVRVRPRPWSTALVRRTAALAAVVLVWGLCVVWSYQPLASLMRNHKELRYWLNPAAPLWSAARVLTRRADEAAQALQPLALDARLIEPTPSRPRWLVIVVGETARAANWGLNGYERQTTPGLKERGVVNWADVRSCGTNTEVSVPCMFAPVGRRDYDEARIRRSESLLHVLARAGAQVEWIDNQSGCKGVCKGLPTTTVQALDPPAGMCETGRCLDEGLLLQWPQRLAQQQGTQVLVLHMLGNHGPSYFRRYPPAFARYQPECRDDELYRCPREAIVNAYDNALLYTDHVLSRLIDLLAAQSQGVDSAMIYVSDHGESLGEAGLYLHGVPYAIAPPEQTRVPMVMWLSEGFSRALGVDMACLQRRAAQPASHDHLFHTVLGLIGVHTSAYESAWDLTAACRQKGPGTARVSE